MRRRTIREFNRFRHTGYQPRFLFFVNFQEALQWCLFAWFLRICLLFQMPVTCQLRRDPKYFLTLKGEDNFKTSIPRQRVVVRLPRLQTILFVKTRKLTQRVSLKRITSKSTGNEHTRYLCRKITMELHVPLSVAKLFFSLNTNACAGGRAENLYFHFYQAHFNCKRRRKSLPVISMTILIVLK